MTTDQNGNRISKNVRRTGEHWAANVWFGGSNGWATNVRTYVYETRNAARNADISDTPGKRGCLRCHV